jgi:hypothetical protein
MLWKAKEKCSGGDCQVAWDYVCRLRSGGGLGVTDLGLQNKCLLLKVLHGLFTGRDSPWTRWVKRSYLSDRLQVATPHASASSRLSPCTAPLRGWSPAMDAPFRYGMILGPHWAPCQRPSLRLSLIVSAPSPPTLIPWGMGLWRSHLFTECLRRPRARWNLYVLTSHISPSPCRLMFVLLLLAPPPTSSHGTSVKLCTPQVVSHLVRTSTGTVSHLTKCGCSSGYRASQKPGHVRRYTTLVVCPLRTTLFVPANLKASHTCLLAAPPPPLMEYCLSLGASPCWC